ncbi:MAG TPA: hypothetical protein VMV10_12525 [Pirellulales bacterium]|nr:hypothetical protein [Pirellulales bacterium]
MQDTLARLSTLDAAGKSTAVKRSADDRFADDQGVEPTASSLSRTLEERCAAIDRVFAQDAAALVESFIRRK